MSRRLRADGFNLLDDVHTFDDGAEHGVLTVQPRGFGGAQEELGAVRVRTGVRHGQDARTGVLEDEVFVFKLVAKDGFALRVPLRLVKSPPWHMKPGMTRWNGDPL